MHKKLRNKLQLRTKGPKQIIAPQVAVSAPPTSQPPIMTPIKVNMYERFRHMRAPELKDLLTHQWLTNGFKNLQVIMDFMNLSEHKEVRCTYVVLKKYICYFGRL